MAKKGTFTSIDVGTTKICTIQANIGDGPDIRVIGFGIAPSRGLKKGLVVNIDEAKESIKESVRKAERASGVKIGSAYVGVTGRHVTSMNNRGVVSTNRSDRLVTPQDIARVLDSARSIEIPNDREMLHVIPRGYALDGQSGVKNPVGMHGFRLDVETHIITAAVASIKNLVKCIRGIGVEIEDLVLEPLASAETVLTPDERDAGVILADIGGGTTDIAIFKDGSICHTAILPVAGYQVTRDISIGLGLPFEVAEEMKKKYGKVMPVANGNFDAATVSSEDGFSFAYKELCQIIEVRMEEILRMILLELPPGEYLHLVPEGLVLTGGSSNLPGIEMLARDVLRLPVRVGMPRGMFGLTDVLHDPAYATSVGLLCWAANHTIGEGLPSQGYWRTIGRSLNRLLFRIRRLLPH